MLVPYCTLSSFIILDDGITHRVHDELGNEVILHFLHRVVLFMVAGVENVQGGGTSNTLLE